MRQRNHTIAKRILMGVLSLAMVFTSVNLSSMTTRVEAAPLYGDTTTLSDLASTGLKLYELTNSDNGATLNTGVYYLTGDVKLNEDRSQYNALKVAENATTYIYIPEGVTLTVYGQNGTNEGVNAGSGTEGKITKFGTRKNYYGINFSTVSGTRGATGIAGIVGTAGNGATGGGAAIYVPSNATLCIMGQGIVNAYGGKGGDAGQGAQGNITKYAVISSRVAGSSRATNANIEFSTNDTNLGTPTISEGPATDQVVHKAFAAVSGAGGSGGGGAGGGGAAIGTNGLKGGNGGAGGASTLDLSGSDYIKKNDGTTGSSSNGNNSVGRVYLSSTIIYSGSQGGNGGNSSIANKPEVENNRLVISAKVYNDKTATSPTSYDFKYYNGMLGGNGGSGGAGSIIGTGGTGGFGGTGGDSGDEQNPRKTGVTYPTPQHGADGGVGASGTASSSNLTAYPYNTVTFTGASNPTQNYYLTQTVSITAPNYTVPAGKYFDGWKVTTAASELPAVFGETATELVKEGKIYQPGDVISTKGIYGNVVLEPIVTSHHHTWFYAEDTSSRDTVLAYCTDTHNAQDCQYQGVDHALKLTIKANDAVYTGSAYSNDNVRINNPISELTNKTVSPIKYYSDETLQTEVTPKTVGTYYAEVTLEEKRAVDSFEIKKADQTGITVGTDDYEYGSTVSTPKKTGGTVAENASPTYYYNTSDSNEGGAEWSTLQSETLEPKTYYVYAVYPATANYNGFTTSASAFEVTPKTIANDKVTATGGNYCYDGKEHGISVTTTIPNATITYGESRDNCNLTESPTYKAARDSAYTVYYEVRARGYRTHTGSATVTINRQNVTIKPDATSKIYGDNDPAYTFKATEGLVDGETEAVLGVTLKRATGEAVGDYAFAIKEATTTNYNVTLATDAPKFKITPKPVVLKWNENDARTYTATEQTMTASVRNKVKDTDTFTLTYENKADENKVNKATAVGTYTAVVTGLGNDNYTLTGAENISKEWKISYHSAEATVSGTKKVENGDWYTSAVVVEPKEAGYQISTDGSDWQNQIPVDSDGDHTVTFYLKQTSTGYITDQMQESFKIDTTAPTGTITIKNNGVTRFFNKVTGGFFFKKTVDVTITAEDPKADGVNAVSDIAKVEYQKTAKGASYTDDGWVTGKSFSVEANEKFDAYARITDKAGNETIIDSKGNVVYQDAVAADEITFTKTSKEDHTTMIAIGVNTIKEVRIQKKQGDADESKTETAKVVAADNYAVKDGKLVLTAAYLDSLQAGDYSITVKYNPYGETFANGQDANPSTITLHVVKATGVVKITSDISRGYNGKPIEAPTFTQNSSAKNATVAYKKADADDTSYTTEAPTEAGSYVVRATVPADENYAEASATTEFTISKAQASISIEEAKQSYTKIYGKDTFSIEGVTTVGENPLTYESDAPQVVSVDKAGKVTIVGAGETKIKLSVAESTNYKAVYAEIPMTVQPKPITVTASNKQKTYGEKDPAFGYRVNEHGLVGSDKLTGILASRVAGENVGSYEITATQKAGVNGNYAIAFAKGALTIEPKNIEGATVTLGSRLTANGSAQAQAVDAVEIDGMAATFTVADNSVTKAGKYTMKITGTGNFTGTIAQTFVVVDPENPADQGNVKVDVVVDPKAPETVMATPKGELMNMLMTADEAAAVADGAELNIWLEVTDASETITDTSKKQIAAGTSGYTIGNYIDISLFKKLSTENEKTQITGTSKAVKIAVAIPKDLQNKDTNKTRTYAIVRNHEGKVEILPTSFDAKTGTLTFETNQFSDYAIIYKDVDNLKAVPANAQNTKTNVPKTGDDFHAGLWMLLMLLGLAGIVGSVTYKKKAKLGKN